MAKQHQQKKVIPPKKKPDTSLRQFSERWYAVIIFVFAIAIYFNSIFNNYNLDDELVTRNQRLTSKGIGAIPEIFASPYYQDQSGYKYEYRPVVLASFAIEHSLFGDNPHVSHFINVLLYGLMCMLLFLVMKDLLKQYSPLLSFLIVLLFTAHPIHTEVVASIKNRDEILALGFALLSWRVAIRFNNTGKIIQLLFVPVLFWLGILSKSTSITFALLIPVSLIMLKGIRLPRLFLITAVLVLPVIFYSRLYSVVELILLIVAIFISVLLLYLIKDAEFDLKKIRYFLSEKYRLYLQPSIRETQSPSSLDFGFFKNKPTFLLLVFFFIALAATSFWGIFIGNMWFSVIPLFVLATSFVQSKKEIKAILITPISLLLIYAISRFKLNAGLMETGLIIFLVSQILSPNKVFKVIGLFNYVIYAAITYFLHDSSFYVMGLLFVGFIDKRLFFVAILFGVFSLLVFFNSGYAMLGGHEKLTFTFLNLPLFCLSILLFWKQKQKAFYKRNVFLLPVFLLLYFIISPPRSTIQIGNGIKKNYHAFSLIKAPDATPVKEMRPLNFIEYPLSQSDSYNIKLGTAMIILGKYLKLIFVPYPMSYYYGYAYIIPTSIWHFVPLTLLLMHIVLFGVALFFIQKNSLLSFSILFYLLSISVFTNLFIPLPGMMGDRFLLIPSIGFCCFIAVCVSKIFKQNFTDSKISFGSLAQPFKISFAVILVMYSMLTFSRNADWKDHITLFRHDINTVENSAQAQNLLGLHLFIASNTETNAIIQKQMREEAVEHLRKAVEIYPQFLNAYFDLGRVYESLQQSDSAYAQYERTVKIDTNFKSPYFSMGIIQQNKGNLETAIPFYEEFLTKYPHQYEVYANMSYAYFKLGKYDSSIAVNKRALQEVTNTFEPNVNIGKTYMQLNEKDSARYYFQHAQHINPADASVNRLLQSLQ